MADGDIIQGVPGNGGAMRWVTLSVIVFAAGAFIAAYTFFTSNFTPRREFDDLKAQFTEVKNEQARRSQFVFSGETIRVQFVEVTRRLDKIETRSERIEELLRQGRR